MGIQTISKGKFQSMVVFFALILWLALGVATGQEGPSVERGAYVFRAAGGCSCPHQRKGPGRPHGGRTAYRHTVWNDL